LQQMKLFAQDKEHFVGSYSALFEEGFLRMLKMRHGTARIKANTVYQEYIGDRNHVHMTATKWVTLTNFVQYLGKAGICVVEHTPKGWYLTYVDRDPAKAQREAERARHEANDLDASERWQLQMEKQLEFIRAHVDIEEYQATELQRAEGDEPLKFKLGAAAPRVTVDVLEADDPEADGGGERPEDLPELGGVKVEVKQEPLPGELPGKGRPKLSFSQMVQTSRDRWHLDAEEDVKDAKGFKSEVPDTKRPKLTGPPSSLSRIMQSDLQRKEVRGRKDHWLHPDIVVKVLNKKVGEGKYYKQKGVVVEVMDRYVATVRMLEMKGTIRVDQEELETVIPRLGGRVLIVNGAFRGEVGLLQTLNTDHFSATLQIAQGPRRGLAVPDIAYEDFCKLHTEDP